MDLRPKLQEFAVKFFEDKEVRAVWNGGEWWYSTADAVGAFANTDNASQYWRTLKLRLKRDGVELVTICNRLKMPAKDGKSRQVDASSERMLLRIVQSMPTARVERIRQWLAEVGAERLQEERRPELITDRAVETNKRRYGMSDTEAVQSVQATAARKSYTGELEMRGITQSRQFAVITNVGHHATFDVTVRKHKDIKDLPPKENLRPHMTEVERTLSMLQEVTAQEIMREKNLHGFYAIRNAAMSSGAIAAHTRGQIERATGKPVVSSRNRKMQNPLTPSQGEEMATKTVSGNRRELQPMMPLFG